MTTATDSQPFVTDEAPSARVGSGHLVLPSVHFSSASDEWTTPKDFFDKCNTEFGPLDLDVCATAENAKCPRFFTKADDGLAQVWTGRVWMNPPYGREIGAWMRKAYESAQAGALVVCLVPARTDTAWWHDYAARGAVRFIRGRLKFGNAKDNAPFPSALVVFHPQNDTDQQPHPRPMPTNNPQVPPPASSGLSVRAGLGSVACAATPREELLRQLLDSRIPKNEREWCAAREIEELCKGLTAALALIEDSYGVAGLHLNADVAPWHELRTGGRYEGWLFDFDQAVKRLPPNIKGSRAEERE